jgi:hypothetical protein
VVSNRYLLYIAIPASALSIFLLIFLLGPLNNDNTIGNNQEISNGQPNEQKEIDDYSVRGAISSTSGGKQVLEEYETHLCGASFEKKTKYIQEHTMPFPCSQPVGITVHQEQQENNRTGPSKVWIAATWIGYLVVFDPDLQRFSDFIEIPNWKTKGVFGSMVWDMEFDKKRQLMVY